MRLIACYLVKIMLIAIRLLSTLQIFKSLLNRATHNQVMVGFAAGMRIIVTVASLPLTLKTLLPSQLQKYVRLFRHTVKNCRLTRQTVIALQRVKRAQNHLAWVTHYKTTRRQFARPMP